MSLQLLKNAESGQVRAILIALCADDEVREKAIDYYRQLNPDNKPGAPISKRARSPSPAIKICVQCETAFDKNNNTKKYCRYHNGELTCIA